jgi:uncharacterized DUF497 family protein
MDFEWDEEKNARNKAKHGVGFEEAQDLFSRPRITAQDTRKEYGEPRYTSIGEIGDDPAVVLVVLHTPRQDKTRLISARRANRKERKAYHAHLKKAAESPGGDAGRAD